MNIGITPVSIMNFFFMLGMSIVLAVDTNMLGNSGSAVYELMIAIAAQKVYAIATFATAVVLFTAFVLRNRYIEIIGLFMSGTFVLVIMTGYLAAFPNISSIAYAVWTLASFMAIIQVLNIIQDEKERKENDSKDC